MRLLLSCFLKKDQGKSLNHPPDWVSFPVYAKLVPALG